MVESLPMSFADRVAVAPAEPGVYLLKDGRGRVIYVGKAKSLRERLRAYVQPQTNPRLAALMHRVREVETIVTRTEVEALVLEENLIKVNRPRYNVRLRDDKRYPYLKLTVQEKFPRIFVTRDTRADGALLFGPYTGVRELRRAVRVVKKLFQVRTCRYDLPEKKPRRPCLEFQVGRCLGPCSGDTGEAEYRQRVNDVARFLAGKSGELIAELERRMWQAAERQDYEAAAGLRDQLAALREVTRQQQAVVPESGARDVVGLARGQATALAVLLRVREGRIVAKEEYVFNAGRDVPDSEVLEGVLRSVHAHTADLPDEIVLPARVEGARAFEELLSGRKGARVRFAVPKRGGKARLVELAQRNAEKSLVEVAPEQRVPKAGAELARLLGLAKVPRVIEGVDISNTQGTDAVGSVVVFQDDRPAKAQYRRFRIRTVQGSDDFAMIQEVLERRLRGRLEKNLPLADLVLVDGGRGQLSAATRAYRAFGRDVPTLGLAKRSDTLYYADGRELSLPLRSPALGLLKRIRDESHRFAITYHRKLRAKRQTGSELDGIPGIGPARRKALVRHFGSMERMRRADVSEIARVPGIGSELAQKIAEELRR
ncbi:MAG: excinuclease ABC subunit UvrC [candidate division WOR-3 bacterium]